MDNHYSTPQKDCHATGKPSTMKAKLRRVPHLEQSERNWCFELLQGTLLGVIWAEVAQSERASGHSLSQALRLRKWLLHPFWWNHFRPCWAKKKLCRNVYFLRWEVLPVHAKSGLCDLCGCETKSRTSDLILVIHIASSMSRAGLAHCQKKDMINFYISAASFAQ